MVPSNFYRLSVKALVIDQTGRFLLFKESDGHWELPGGGLDYDEDPLAGLRREVREESGLSLMKISKSPAYFVTGPRDDDTYAANIIYLAELKNLDFKPTEECVEIKFFNHQEAAREDLFSTVKALLKVYHPKIR